MHEPTELKSLSIFRSLAQEILETEHNITKIKDSTVYESKKPGLNYTKSTKE